MNQKELHLDKVREITNKYATELLKTLTDELYFHISHDHTDAILACREILFFLDARDLDSFYSCMFKNRE